MNDVYILGIESSCDDTSAAVLKNNVLLSNVTANQSVHALYGGVVPELASRAHQQNIIPVVDAALKEAGVTKSQLSAVAFTRGPGLLGSLLVGASFAKGFSQALGIRLVEVNHLQAHVLAHFISRGDEDELFPEFPFLCLLVSGGNSQIVLVNAVNDMKVVGQTIDDAAGEAFDKVAKMLDLGFPGGPAVERAAASDDPRTVPLPRPLLGSGEPHFSFAGLKTAVLRAVQSGQYRSADIAASFQQAVVDCLVDRTAIAIGRAMGATALVVAGGVAANRAVRHGLEQLAMAHDLPFIAPPLQLCTDNAAMIAWAAQERIAIGDTPHPDPQARPRWPLDPDADAVRGAGVKA